MRYTLRQLEVFIAIAQNGNLTRAADQLAMSQSAASSALKDLENQFDIQLFDRVGKRLQLNEQGRLLLPEALSLMEQAYNLQANLMQHSNTGKLRLGATLTIGNYLAVGMIAQYMQQHPGADVSLTVDNTEHIVAKLLNFELDVAMIEGEINHPDLDIHRWQDDELVVFCNTKHPLAKRGLASDEELTHARWILREEGSGTRQAFDRGMHGLLPQLTVAIELEHTEAIKRAVQAGLGIGCLSRITLEDAFKRGDLVAVRTPQRDFGRSLYIVLHRQKFRTAGLNAWLELCGNL
ncbi:LysR family transcriptional regulator [Oceanobacter mangrovi]|uniref:LysR family transcriptional regulator n=1 Tax=Oceanobacter mangrovi TaxID=2862510 RepID=UPI001C8E697B|nr:LysR family transcriptional regulator [Oceanobacter mangrovi]